MLYDPKWEKQTKAEPFTRAHVIAWLEAHEPTETYCYIDNGRCLIAQYLTFLGHKEISVGALGYYDSDRTGKRRVGDMFGAARVPKFLHQAAVNRPYNFGAALERARAVAAR